MSSPASASATQSSDAPSSGSSSPKSPSSNTPATSTETALSNDTGKITVNDTVVTKVAGLAAHEVSGVHAMGAGSARAYGSIKQRIPGSSSTNTVAQGVSVETGESEAAIDLDIVIEYGVSIADLGRSIQNNVKQSVERITGLKVVEVNVNVDDVYLGESDEESDQPDRVQ